MGPCAACRSALRAEAPVVVQVAATPPLVVVAGGVYEGRLRGLLIAAKERQSLVSIGVLSDRLAVSIIAVASVLPEGRVVLVPVPSVAAAVARRGVRLTTALARAAASSLRAGGVDVVVAERLRLVRQPRDQAGLTSEERRANLHRAHRATPPPAGLVVLVDDIVTTGASLSEAARALRECGGPAVAAVTVAATPRRRRISTR